MCDNEKYTWKPANLDGENHDRGSTEMVNSAFIHQPHAKQNDSAAKHRSDRDRLT